MGFRQSRPLSEDRMVNKAERESTRNVPEKGLFKEIEAGAGNLTFKMDRRGIWLGDQVMENAPFSVDMYGNISIRASSLTQNAAIRFYDADGNLAIFIGYEDIA